MRPYELSASRWGTSMSRIVIITNHRVQKKGGKEKTPVALPPQSHEGLRCAAHWHLQPHLYGTSKTSARLATAMWVSLAIQEECYETSAQLTMKACRCPGPSGRERHARINSQPRPMQTLFESQLPAYLAQRIIKVSPAGDDVHFVDRDE
jgi:hypothetical protein